MFVEKDKWLHKIRFHFLVLRQMARYKQKSECEREHMPEHCIFTFLIQLIRDIKSKPFFKTFKFEIQSGLTR